MEMTLDYMVVAADALAKDGYVVTRTEEPDAPDGAGAFARHTFKVTRGDEEHWVFETLIYPDGARAYYIEIVRYYGLHTFSVPLDSWRVHADRIEFKYEATRETAQGLSLTLAFKSEG